MILGSITYRRNTILDFGNHWVIGSPRSHIKFDSLEDAKQWIDEFYKTKKILAVKKYFSLFGCFPPIEDLVDAVNYVGERSHAETIVNKYFYG